MNEMKEAVGNWREAKQFSPADENDLLRRPSSVFEGCAKLIK